MTCPTCGGCGGGDAMTDRDVNCEDEEQVSEMPARPQETDSEAKRTQEPESVKVAWALGWTNICQRPACTPTMWRGDAPDGRGYWPVPNFANDPAFVVQIQAENRLTVRPVEDGWLAANFESPFSKQIAMIAQDPGRAVCAWIISAAAAGVEIKR
jgi:hypothetical protein